MAKLQTLKQNTEVATTANKPIASPDEGEETDKSSLLSPGKRRLKKQVQKHQRRGGKGKKKKKTTIFSVKLQLHTHSILDVLWGQPIKLIQVASTSELHENQQNDLLFFEIVPCHCCRVSEVSKIDWLKN